MANARIDYGVVMRLLVARLETIAAQVAVAHLGEPVPEGQAWTLAVTEFAATPVRRQTGGSEPDRAVIEVSVGLAQDGQTTDGSVAEALTRAAHVQAVLDEAVMTGDGHTVHLDRCRFRVGQVPVSEDRTVLGVEFRVAGNVTRATGDGITTIAP